MKIAKAYQKDVFCLEGDWNRNLLKQNSVIGALDFLKQNRNIHYIHRHCGTKENLAFYLQQWQYKRYARYSICYMAFHGKPNQILINKEPLNLDELAAMMGDKCHNKIIHFGSCQTLNTDIRNIRRFLRKTNALCVCGFKEEIKFVEGSAFDILLLDMFQDFLDVSRVEAHIRQYYRSFAEKLQFKLIHL
jgi:hypothetical protein